MLNEEDRRPNEDSREEGTKRVDVNRKPLPKKQWMLPRPRVYLSFPHNTEAPANVLPGSLRVHPRGFRLLKGCSPLERRMNSYFRLPARPARIVVEEQRKIIAEAAKCFPPPGQTKAGTHEVQLDGFILLEACGVQDPSDAKECVLNDSNLRGSATEDLPYFTSLRVLDLGENNMEMADVCQLEALEELHLHCNGVRTLRLKKPQRNGEGDNVDGDDDDGDDTGDDSGDVPVFQRLATLNLSFNQIPFREIASLSLLRSLERLDLSSNSLRHLPADLSGLANVSQLALENNKFSDPQVLLALSTMPSLLEVNLNFNQFTSVPRLSMEDGAGVCFPVLQVIGLASNQMEYFEDVYALTQVATLRRVVLWGNPVERKLKDCEILIYEFGALQVQVVLESPIPPKRSIGEFYAANTQNFVRVTQRELKPIPKKGGAPRKAHTAPSHDGGGAGEPAGGPSFFVTQVGLEQQQRGEDSRGGTGGDDDGASHASRQQRHPQQQPAEDASWFAATPHDSDPPSSAPAQRAHAGRHQGHPGATRRLESSGDGVTDGGQSSFMGTFDADATDWGPVPGSRDDVCQPNAGVRAVMAELKRMLRQPLPPIHVPQYEQSTVSKSMRSRGNRGGGGI